ncbi:partial 4'-phosphopantetheinyl transferase, partial [Burkholderiaceae bacterium]
TGSCRFPSQASVRTGADGRPVFDASTLSISHSRHEAMAAVARTPIGVDTETFDAMRADSLAALVRPREAEALRRGLGCDLPAARTLAWCLKEALFKATGSGAFAAFAGALQLLQWTRGDPGPEWRWDAACAPADAPAARAWQARFGIGADAAWVLVAPASAPANSFDFD